MVVPIRPEMNYWVWKQGTLKTSKLGMMYGMHTLLRLETC